MRLILAIGESVGLAFGIGTPSRSPGDLTWLLSRSFVAPSSRARPRRKRLSITATPAPGWKCGQGRIR
jgi:hypothetical protein